MNETRILVALELRSYRETIAEVVGMLMPEAKVRLSEPGDLDRKIALWQPAVVLCSRVTPAVEEKAPFWIEMYPDHGPSSTIKTPVSRREIPDFELSDLAGVLGLAGLSPGDGLAVT